MTRDGGLNWMEQELNDSCLFTSVAFLDTSTVFITGLSPYWFGAGGPRKGVIYKSIDGGNSWNRIKFHHSPLQSISVQNESQILAVGDLGSLLLSDDSGETWTEISSNILEGDKSLYSIDFWDSLTGIIVGQSGIVLKTTDGGNNWTFLENVHKSSIRDVCFIDQNTIVASTDVGVIKSTDGGHHWKQTFYATPTWHVSFVDSEIGYTTILAPIKCKQMKFLNIS